MDFEMFGGIIDNLLTKYPVQMLINIPEGTVEPDVKDNIGFGPSVQFYILLSALEKVLAAIIKMGDVSEEDKERFVNSVLELVKGDLLNAEEGEDAHATD